MDESQKTLQRLERLRQLNTDRERINTDLYRLLYKRDLYILAYERIKSAPGNMTPGTDGKTIDGRWEISHDGTTWEDDLQIFYRRITRH